MNEQPASFPIRKWPEGERPREKLIQFGAESLTDAELLAILLRVGHEGASAIDIREPTYGWNSFKTRFRHLSLNVECSSN